MWSPARDGVGVADVHFVHAWPMLAVVAFDFDAAIAHHACDTPQQVLVGARLADRVAVEPRVQGRQGGSKVFVAQADHGLAEEAKLQFGGGQRLKAQGACSFDDALQDVARRDGDSLSMLAPQVADGTGDVVFPRLDGKRGEIRFHDDVGKAAFPVAELQVGQDDFSDVPAKEHVALRKAVLQGVQKVPGGNAFASVHAFDVGGSNLDVLDFAFFDQPCDLC